MFSFLAKRLGIALIGPIAAALILLIGFSFARTNVSPPDAVFGNDTPLINISTTIAFRAGLIRQANSEEAKFLKEIHRYECNENEEEVCDEPGLANATPPDQIWWLRAPGGCGDNITQSIIATESYLRPIWRQNVENAIASTLYEMIGYLPDWSLGPAQIRPSTAKRITDKAAEWVELNTGRSLNIAYETQDVLYSVLRRCPSASLIETAQIVDGSTGSGARARALRHVGGHGYPTIPGVVEYATVISVMSQEVLAEAEHQYALIVGDSLVEEYEDEEKLGNDFHRVEGASWMRFNGLCVELSDVFSDANFPNSGNIKDLNVSQALRGETPRDLAVYYNLSAFGSPVSVADVVDTAGQVSSIKLTLEHFSRVLGLSENYQIVADLDETFLTQEELAEAPCLALVFAHADKS